MNEEDGQIINDLSKNNFINNKIKFSKIYEFKTLGSTKRGLIIR